MFLFLWNFSLASWLHTSTESGVWCLANPPGASRGTLQFLLRAPPQ